MSNASERFNDLPYDSEMKGQRNEGPREVEIIFWEPTGWGESSMGHVSSRNQLRSTWHATTFEMRSVES